MNPLLVEAIGAIVRWGLTFVAGYLIKAGIWTEASSASYIVAGSAAIIALGWSIWQKYKMRLKFLMAASAPRKMTEEQVEEQVKTNPVPSVTTPKTEVPKTPPTKEE